jgi:hypothetical protein
MKVAQYEVLEMTQKRDVRPARDDRNVRLAHLLSAIYYFHPPFRL